MMNRNMKRLKRYFRYFKNYLAWLLHVDRFRVSKSQRKHYKRIFTKSMNSLGMPPCIYEGDDYNNKIKWLMLYDQTPEHIIYSDKIKVRDYISEKIGDKYLVPMYQICGRADDINFDVLPTSFVIKTNHDSGSVWVVNDISKINIGSLKSEIDSRLDRKFGWDNGEWYYSYISPRIIIEKNISENSSSPDDYKFHCSNGKVLLCQYIYDRDTGITKEQLITADGRVQGYKLDHEFVQGDKFEVPSTWNEMLRLCETLSSDLRYIRIDLYSIKDKIYFGELSWHPRSGNYRGHGQELLGQMLYIDRNNIKHPIVKA